MITRRSLIARLPVFLAAPAIIRVADIMPIKVERTPDMVKWFGEVSCLDRFRVHSNPPWWSGRDGDAYPSSTNCAEWFESWLRVHPNAVPAGD